MVQPRPKRPRQARLKRAKRRYIRARFKAGLVKAAIAQVAALRDKDPYKAEHAIRWLPLWMRRNLVDGTPLPEPDMWAFYWRGRGRKNLGDPRLLAKAEPPRVLRRTSSRG